MLTDTATGVWVNANAKTITNAAATDLLRAMIVARTAVDHFGVEARDEHGLVGVVAVVGSLALLSVAGLAGARAAAIWAAAEDGDQAGCGCGPDGCGGHSGTDAADTGCADGSADSPAGACSPTDAGPSAPGDPAADCGVTGGCGSCALQGMCETESATR